MDAFELRVADTLLWYADDVSTTVDAAAVAHRAALEHPRNRVGALSHRLAPARHLAWVLIVVAALLAMTLAGLLVAGAGPRPERTLQTLVPPVEPIAWPAWSPASSADTALVDQFNVVMNGRDMAALDEVFAIDMVFALEGEAYGGLEGIREHPPTVALARVGDVAVTYDPVPGLWSLPTGSRFLAFVEDTGGELRDMVFEVNGEDKVAVFYNEAHLPPAERARDGYTRVDFTMIAGLETRTVGVATRSDARLSLVETDRVDAAELPGCQRPAGGSTYVFLRLRLEGLGMSPRDVASDTIEVRGSGGERFEPASCQREPAFRTASGAQDGWLGVVVPADAVGRMSLVYRHIDDSRGNQERKVYEALIPFDLPPG
jgi:hypothetical protein